MDRRVPRVILCGFFLMLGASLRGQESQRGIAEADLAMQLRSCDELSVANPVEALTRVELALAAAEASAATPLQRARLQLCRGEMLMRGGRAEEALLTFVALGDMRDLDDVTRARVSLRLGGALVMQARVTEARPHLAAAAALMTAHPDAETEALLLGVEGVVLQTECKYDAALAKYFEARQRAAGLGKDHLESQLLYNIATLQMATGDRVGAGQSLEAARRLARGGHHLAMILGAQSDLLGDESDQVERRRLLDAGLRIETEIGSRSGQALFYRRLGSLEVTAGRLPAAIEHFQASLALTRAIGNDESIASSLRMLADVYISIGDADRAMVLAEEALTRCDRLRMPVIEQQVAGTLSDACAKAGKFDRALELHRRSAAAALFVANESKAREVERIRAEYDAQLVARQHEVALAREFMLRNAAIAAAVAAMLVLAFVVRMLRQKAALMRESMRQTAEIRAAQQQMTQLGAQLGVAIEDVRRLSGLLPICMHCKSIREDDGSWHRLEQYVSNHSDASFTHGICPSCMHEHFPEGS